MDSDDAKITLPVGYQSNKKEEYLLNRLKMLLF